MLLRPENGAEAVPNELLPKSVPGDSEIVTLPTVVDVTMPPGILNGENVTPFTVADGGADVPPNVKAYTRDPVVLTSLSPLTVCGEPQTIGGRAALAVVKVVAARGKTRMASEAPWRTERRGMFMGELSEGGKERRLSDPQRT